MNIEVNSGCTAQCRSSRFAGHGKCAVDSLRCENIQLLLNLEEVDNGYDENDDDEGNWDGSGGGLEEEDGEVEDWLN